MKLRLDIITEEILSQYNLWDIAVDGWVYCEIRKGMYGLPHVGKFLTTASSSIYKHTGTHQLHTLPAIGNITLGTPPSPYW